MRLSKTMSIGTATLMAALTLVSGSVQADQNSKNQWRNLSIGAGALGAIGLATHSGPLAILGIGGAAYSASRYEKDRHHQSEDNGYRRDRHFHRNNDNYGGWHDNDNH